MSDPAALDLLAQNGLFRSLIDQSPLMVLVFDASGGCLFSSRARLAFSGRTMAQEQGWGWVETVHPEDTSSISAAVLDAITSRKPFVLEHRVFRADGALRWISTQGIPWSAPSHEYLGHLAISVDVTDQRQADGGERVEPRALRRLIEHAQDMVYRTRYFPTHELEYIGGAVLAITGHTAAEFYATPNLAAKCVHPEDWDRMVTTENLPHAPSVAILRWIHPNGRVVHAEHRRVTIYDDTGQILAVEGIARDVTEFVEAQQRLRESEEQLRQLAARLHDAREAERAQVARELHDELGQTLTALKLDITRMAQVLTREHLTPPIVDRLQSLIGLSDIGLATVKRIATTLRPPTLDHLGLAEAIHWEAVTFKARTGLRCTVRTNKARTALSAEQQTALFRIFQEAMTNIVRHAQASAVQVTLTERAERFEMRIRDNGRGITETQSEDPARDWVAWHARADGADGRSVSYLGTQGKRNGRIDRSAGCARERRDAGRAEDQSRQMIRILLVDDHPVARQGIRTVLIDRVKDAVVGEAADAVSALKQVRSADWDLMIADISLQGMSGLELIKEVRRIRPTLPTLVLSMHPASQFARRALSAGAIGYLTKGSELEEFVNAIEHVRRGRRYISRDAADLLVRRSVNWEVAPHETLSDREYQVLRLLGSGKTISDIGRDLGLSVKTVSTYRARVLDKLGMRSNAELMRYAIENRLLES